MSIKQALEEREISRLRVNGADTRSESYPPSTINHPPLTKQSEHYEKFWTQAGAGNRRHHHHRDTDYNWDDVVRGILVLLMWTLNVSFL